MWTLFSVILTSQVKLCAVEAPGIVNHLAKVPGLPVQVNGSEISRRDTYESYMKDLIKMPLTHLFSLIQMRLLPALV